VLFAALAAAPSAGWAMDIQSLWDYGQPAQTEQRLRDALPRADADERLELLTQIARTYSLRRDFDRAHRLLDEVQAQLAVAGIKPKLRYLLERGRSFNSAGDAARARPLFVAAWEQGRAAGEEDLAIDAAHMVAIVDGGEEGLRWNRMALPLAQQTRDPQARRWTAPLLNNIGDQLRTLERYDEALESFRLAVPAYEVRGNAADVRMARWQVANTLRLLGRVEEALDMQLALERECDAAGEPDGYVYEELGELYAALAQPAKAQAYFAKALESFSRDEGMVKHEAARLDVLRAKAR
jgi:tetratricopeptide (TPR) repeat protein